VASGASLYTLSYLLRIEASYFTPDFFPVLVKVNEGGGELKTIDKGQFATDFFLDVETDEKNFVSKFVFELVHDGLNACAANSVGGLEFQ